MIAYLKGKLVYKTPTEVIIEVNQIGYEVKISLNTFLTIKNLEECTLFIYEHIREDTHLLYGFSDVEEKKCFLFLNNVHALGATTAMTILSSLSIPELQAAILKEDVNTLKKIKGIGFKTAQRIILELKEKIHQLRPLQTEGTSPMGDVQTEALQALIKLGISKSVAEKAIQEILVKHQYNISLEELIKLAIHY